MEKVKKLNKLAWLFASIVIIAFCVCAAPLVTSLVFALVSLVICLFAIVVVLVGGFIGLLAMASGSGLLHKVMAFATTLFRFGGVLFSWIEPISRFSFTYVTPYATIIGCVCAVVGIVLSALSLSASKKLSEQELTIPAQEGKKGKSKNLHKKAKSALIVSIIFMVLCLITLIFAKTAFSLVS